MEYDGDLMAEYLEIDHVPQLGFIDELMNITVTDHDINGVVLEIDSSKGGEVLELGFEADAYTNNNEGVLQEERDGILESDVGLGVVRDNLPSDARSTPRKKSRGRWTEQEQRQLMKALKDGLVGQWAKISRLYIPSRTPAQITSHAQKFSLRMKNSNKKRKSINDYVDTDDVNSTVVNGEDKWSNEGLSSPHYNNQVYDPSSSMSTVNTVVNGEEKWSNEGLSSPHYNNQVHDPSSSMSTVNTVVNGKEIKWSNEGLSSPHYNQVPNPSSSMSTVNMPPLMPATPMPMNMPLPPAYDAISSYYVNQFRLLEKQKNMVMMMLNYFRQYHIMNMASPMINGPSGLLPGTGSYYDGSYGVDALEPYSDVGTGSSFAANTTTYHDDVHASYYNGHLQWVKPEPSLGPLQYDQQTVGHDHVVLP